MDYERMVEFRKALKADAVIPVTGLSIYELRQELARRNQLIKDLRDELEGLAERFRALIRLLGPQEMTPLAMRQFKRLLDEVEGK